MSGFGHARRRWVGALATVLVASGVASTQPAAVAPQPDAPRSSPPAGPMSVAPALSPNLPLPAYTPVRAGGVALPSNGLPTLAPPVPQETPPGLASAAPPTGELPMGSTSGPGVAVRLGSPGAGDAPFRPATGGTGAGPGPRGADYPDKDITVFLGGRVQLDAVDYIAPAALRRGVPGTYPLDPGVSFRRLRIDASGSIYKHTDYMVQIDFVNGLTLGPGGPRSTDIAVPTDAWVTFKDLPVVGNVRVGNHKPLYSFEHLTSSRYLNFMERSLGFDAFAEGFNNGFEPGISAFDTYLDKRGTWGVGLFKNTRVPFAFGVGHNELDVNGRVTFLPVYENDGKLLVHVGVGASHRDPDDGQVRFRSRFDARNSPSGLAALVADTGLVNASQQHLIVPELVMVAGPLSIQSEFYGSWVNDARPVIGGQAVPVGTAFLYSAYAEAHLFLTGEHRAYNRGSGVFGAVKPLRPVDWSRCGFTGCGAWQLTARYSYLNLNDKGIVGGRVNDMTLGVNWFLNQFMKVQGNYFLADRDAAGTAGDGIIHGFATRLAFDF